MINTYNTSAILALVLTLAAGCAGGGKTTGSGGTQPNPFALGTEMGGASLDELRATYSTTPVMAVKGQMSISGVPATVWFEATLKGYDSMKVVLTGPFGMALGAMSATPDHFEFFNAVEGELTEGRPNRETLGKVMLVELDYYELAGLMRGELSHFPKPGTYTCRAGDGSGMLSYSARRGLRLETFTMDTTLPAVTSYSRVLTDSSGTMLTNELGIIYKTFTRLGGRRFPKNATVNVASGKQVIQITVDRISDKLDDGATCAIQVPGDIPRKKL